MLSKSIFSHSKKFTQNTSYLKSFTAALSSNVNVVTTKEGINVINLQKEPNSEGNGSVAVGLFVKTGTRYENLGLSQAFKSLAFMDSTLSLGIDNVRDIEMLGLKYQFDVARENISYILQQSDSYGPNESFERLTTLLTGFSSPSLKEYIIRDALPFIQSCRKQISTEPQFQLEDQLYQTAYRNNGLGNSLIGSSATDSDILTNLLGFAKETFYDENKLVFVAVGDLKENHYKSLQNLERKVFKYSPIDRALLEADTDPCSIPYSPSKYVGGESIKSVSGLNTSLVGLGFEGAKLGSEKTYSLKIIEALLGRGGQNLNPGQGITSRLNQNIDNTHFGIDYSKTINNSHSDSGLFSIVASVSNEKLPESIEQITKQGFASLNNITEQEFQKAKNLAKTNTLVSFSQTSNVVKFIGEQAAVLPSNEIVTPDSYLEKLDKVTLADVQKDAKELISGNPTLVVSGNTKDVPMLSSIASWLK